MSFHAGHHQCPRPQVSTKPTSLQSFGCHDKGSKDPGEDLCGEDEAPYDDSYYRTKAAALCDTTPHANCAPFGSAYVTVHYLGHDRSGVTLTIQAPKKHVVTGGNFGIIVATQPCGRQVVVVDISLTYSVTCTFTLPFVPSEKKTHYVEVGVDIIAAFCALGGIGGTPGGGNFDGTPDPDVEGCAGGGQNPFIVPA